ncbi:unnamed protein product [Vicia faba]|uniref:Uncharacterized protein n=1 Tax=Vicia faba TaxID=3906 RepID=A0AAV0ZND9_VICFA|nr:unnamed protein product [Vicia faba]
MKDLSLIIRCHCNTISIKVKPSYMESFTFSTQLHFHALNKSLIEYPLSLPLTTAKPFLLLKRPSPEPPPPPVVFTPSKLSTIRSSPKLLMLM